jgi:hypothetical protein
MECCGLGSTHLPMWQGTWFHYWVLDFITGCETQLTLLDASSTNTKCPGMLGRFRIIALSQCHFWTALLWLQAQWSLLKLSECWILFIWQPLTWLWYYFTMPWSLYLQVNMRQNDIPRTCCVARCVVYNVWCEVYTVVLLRTQVFSAMTLHGYVTDS